MAARCAHVRAGVGAVASQNVTDPRLGPRGLDLMAAGASAEQATYQLVKLAPGVADRRIDGVVAAADDRTVTVATPDGGPDRTLLLADITAADSPLRAQQR